MGRLDQLRARGVRERRTRRWRDGCVCAGIGAFGGLIYGYLMGTLWGVPIAAVACGVLGAVVGERVLRWLW